MSEKLFINIKRLHPDAVIPEYANPGDAGVDLVAVERKMDYKRGEYTYYTGLAIEIPKGYVGKIYARSSVHKKDLILANCVGIIDSGYRGELKIMFKKTSNGKRIYRVGERVAQLIIEKVPSLEFNEVDQLSPSERGVKGFGSSGK